MENETSPARFQRVVRRIILSCTPFNWPCFWIGHSLVCAYAALHHVEFVIPLILSVIMFSLNAMHPPNPSDQRADQETSHAK